MKIGKYIKSTLLAASLAFTGTHRADAVTVITNTFTFSFPTGGQTTPFNDPTWIYWYNSPGGNTPILNDPTTGTNSPTPGANTGADGSLMIVSPLAGYTQDIFFGCFGDDYGYDFNTQANTVYFSSVSFDVLVAPGTPLSGAGNYGSIHVGFINTGYGFEEITASPVTIPASASNHWFHVSVPIDQTQNFGDVPGIALGINSYGGYPLFTFTNWIANISINGSTAPPPPPPTVSTPVTPLTGLNLIDTTPASQYNRYQIVNSNDNSGGLSFYGQTSPVTYSWTIKSFPGTNDGANSYQAHFFIVSGSDSATTTTIYPGQYDTAADYNLANCIFVTVQWDGTTNAAGAPAGGNLNFRYKTNQIGGNGMLFNTTAPGSGGNSNNWPVMPVASLDDTNGLLGTWSLTFSGNTSVTITSPTGLTTNFTFDAASAQLFADPCSLLLGAHHNTVFTNGLKDNVVYSKFSLTGTPAAYTDNFATDSTLNTNYWGYFSSDNNGSLVVPPGSAYWVGWSLPANHFGLFSTPSLSQPLWTAVASTTVIKDGAMEEALVPASALPSGGTKNAFFAVISNAFTQLQVLLPGETNAPGTLTGKTGTFTPPSINANGGTVTLTVTVLAVDKNFNPVPGVTDTVSVTDSGGGFDPNSAALANGSGQFTIYYTSPANGITVTAADTTTPTITSGVSSTFNILP